MKPAVIYARFSPRRNADECESCDLQEELCRAFCVSKQWRVVGAHRDEAISGGSMSGRHGLARALKQAKKHKAALVVYSLSRLARSTRDTIEIADQLEAAGADLVCLKESFDTSTASGKLLFQILAALAEFERTQISERTRDAMLRYQAEGRIMGRIPWGFKPDPDSYIRRLINGEERMMPTHMIPDPRAKEVEAIMVGLRKSGLSLREVARKLTELGIPSPQGLDWNQTMVWTILKRLEEKKRRAAQTA